MILKQFYLNTWLRIVFILITCFAIPFVVIPKPDWFFLANLFLILLIQVFLLLRSQNKINRELDHLFDSLESSDTTLSFQNKSNDSQFDGIYKRFDQIMQRMQELKLDSLQKTEYLSILFEHINIGILSISNNELIRMKNSTAHKILGRGSISNLEDLRQIDSSFANAVIETAPGESKLISLYKDGYLQHLLIRVALLKFNSEEIKIVSFQNIKGELDEREMEGWQKLIRVLTHELMNSVGPINSTISTLMELLPESNTTSNKKIEVTNEVISDTIKGLKIIEERSKGMMDFVTRFRSLTLIPQPVFTLVNVDELIQSIILLLHDEVEKSKIQLHYKTRYSNLKAYADKGMIEQILINLIINSIEALKEIAHPEINISVWSDNNSVYMDVADNGKGIPQQVQEKIFIPFFTTRKEGTGIGLSLSRQLANVQGGALALTKSVDHETIFTLRLKQIL